MVKIKANELDANDEALVQKLHQEVIHLRQVLNLRKKGKIEEIQKQLMQLQKENNRLRQLANNVEEVERLKLENKIMKLELQRMRYEEGSYFSPDGENASYTGSFAQLNMNQYELNGVMRSGAHSEIERAVDTYMPLKCPLCNSLPPCAHYGTNTDYEPRSVKHKIDDSHTQRINTFNPGSVTSSSNMRASKFLTHSNLNPRY